MIWKPPKPTQPSLADDFSRFDPKQVKLPAAPVPASAKLPDLAKPVQPLCRPVARPAQDRARQGPAIDQDYWRRHWIYKERLFAALAAGEDHAIASRRLQREVWPEWFEE